MPTPQKQNSEEKKKINREQWIATAHEAIASLGLRIIQEKKPYKAFRDKERFFIRSNLQNDNFFVIPVKTDFVFLSNPNFYLSFCDQKSAR